MKRDYKGREYFKYNTRGEWYARRSEPDVAYSCVFRSAGTSFLTMIKADSKAGERWEMYMPEQVSANCPTRILFVRDPWDRLVSNWRWCKQLDAAEIPEERKLNKPTYEQFVDLILDEDERDGHWFPFTELVRARGDVYLPTEHVRLDRIGEYFPNIPTVNVSDTTTHDFDLNYRKADLEAFYAEDIAIWNAIQ